jgi:hypothetical protein
MFGALRDCVLPLKQSRHDPPEVMLDAFNQEISKQFDEVNTRDPLYEDQIVLSGLEKRILNFLQTNESFVLNLHVHKHIVFWLTIVTDIIQGIMSVNHMLLRPYVVTPVVGHGC